MKKRSIPALVKCGLGLLLAAQCLFASENHKIIFHNGKIFTANSQKLWAQGLVVNGRHIAKVGTSQEVLADKDNKSQVIDLQGRTVIPGLNNSHVHSFWSSAYPHAVKLNNKDFVPNAGPNFQTVLNLISAAAAKQPAGTWLFVDVGASVVEDATVDRYKIDAVAPNHPVLMTAWWGHSTYFNTKAMQVMGLAEEQADPFGGFYERVKGSNVLKGIAHEYAEFLINRYFANQMTDQEFVTLFKNFEKAAFRFGYTSIQDYPVGLTHTRNLDLLDQSGLAIRWRSIAFPLTLDEPSDKREKFSPLCPDNLIMASGIKWISEGSPFERLSALTTEYKDMPGWHGRSSFNAADFKSIFTRAMADRPELNQTQIHITGDANWDAVFTAMSSVAPDCDWKKRRTRIEHGDLMRPDHMIPAKEKGIVVIQNPTHFSITDIFAQRFQPSVLANIMPYKTLLKQGIPVGLGTDSITEVGNPYLDIFLSLVVPANPAEKITVEEAVTAYTQGSAYAEFQDQHKGTLQPGKLADLAVLSQDIFTAAPPSIIGTESLLTMVGGKIVHNTLPEK